MPANKQPQRSSQQPRANMSVTLILLVTISLLVSCGPEVEAQQPATSAQATPSEPARQVRVVEVEEGVLSTSRSTSVTIDPAQESTVAAGTSGQVANISIREGVTITEGELVVQLDDVDLRLRAENSALSVERARIDLRSAEIAASETQAQALASLRAAETNLQLAETRFNEGQSLLNAGGIASTEVTSLQANLAQARSNYQLASDSYARSLRANEETLALLRIAVQSAQNGLDQARESLSETRITAPFSGEVAEILVEEGEFVGSGSPVFRVSSTEEQLARFSVPPADADNLVEQGVIFIPYNGLDYAAQIIRNSQVSGQTRLVDITAQIYPSETRIPIGTVTQLPYQIDLAEGGLLPSGAVQAEAGSNFVYVIEDDRAQRQTVNILAEAGGRVALTGIDVETEVIFPVPADLRAGTRVNIIRPEGDGN
jgi:multidrug efflux pump subunit AcrA (membrane-fusion protein)